jgi:hypothetical protein
MSFQYSVATDLKATGTNISNALVLENGFDYYFIESATSNSGVKIPFCDSGNQVTIVNHTNNTILAYPQPSGTINAQAPGIPQSLAAEVSIRFITSNGIDWHSLIDTTVPVAPIITPNKVLGTDSSGNLIGIGGYSSTPGVASSFTITDAKGELNTSTLNTSDLKSNSATVGTVNSTAINSGSATIGTLNNTVLNSNIINASSSLITPLITTTNVTASGTISGSTVQSTTLTNNGNATIGGNVVVTGGIGAATTTTGSLTVSGSGTINSLTASSINVSNLQINLPFNQNISFSQNVTANAFAGVLKIGQFLPFSFNNSFITRSNIVLLDTWVEYIGTTNTPHIYCKRSQDPGVITFTIQNPGSNAYVACVLVLQWFIVG